MNRFTSPFLRAVRPPLWLLPATIAVVAWAAGERVAFAADPSAARAEDLEFFETKVRPLLVAHCAECHSRTTGDPEGGLSFDSRADFLAAEGVAVAGKPDESLIVQVVRYDGDLQMPPDGRLPPAAIETITEWVRRGLPWPQDAAGPAGGGGFDIATRKAEHWCWQPPRAAPAPAVRDTRWGRGEIDRFVLARLEAAGLAPAPEAPREVLVRRAAEILTGLPADPAAVARVNADPDPAAFDRYVDELLASPHFGERFARHWLDVVRYGESRGHEFDFPIPNAWRYRDWVVKAFNDDVPYDQFIREQIAGDLLPRPRLDPASGANESVVGTGFWFLGEGVHAPVDVRQDEADRVDNCVDTFGKAFLGMALGCARCHDHKFDAISNEDYYAIAGMVMSSSYRQVPFETLEANRGVAAGIDRARAAARRSVLPLVADAVAAREDLLPAILPGPADVEAARETAARAAATPPPTVIADYTRSHDSTPILSDGWAWGLETVTAGMPVPLPAIEGLPREVRLATTGAAVSDAVWSTTQTAGERDPGPVGQVDRAGRVLRTPKVRVREGVLWHRVRGHVQILTIVDGHVILSGGPLLGGNLLAVNTQGEWRWIRQDLRRDLTWEQDRVVHVEYAAVAGAVAVAEVVASATEPLRPDPLAAFLVPAASAAAGTTGSATAGRELFAAAVRDGRAGDLGTGPAGPAAAALVARLLAAPGFEWNAAPARRLAEAAVAAEESIAAAASAARLVSATAPAMLDGNGIDQHVLLKGSASRRGELSPRRFLEAIDGATQPAWPARSSGRHELADRVLDPRNPLTTRVMVNRVWHHLFGRGLAPTTDNFGKLGEPAADPLAQALLDTLAVRFRDEGYGVKRLVREIVTSSTWRMSSARQSAAAAHDPTNLLLHHFPLRRLEGESIRDKILAVSGRLDRTVGGPGVDAHLNEFQEGRGRPASGPLDGAGRRSIYTHVRRNFLPGFLLAFDMPVPFQAVGRRNVTNVPAQALALMNDPFVAEQAAVWARKTLADEALVPAARIRRMYLEAFAREPSAAELSAASDFLAAHAAAHGRDVSQDPRDLAAWTDLAHALVTTKEFIFVP